MHLRSSLPIIWVIRELHRGSFSFIENLLCSSRISLFLNSKQFVRVGCRTRKFLKSLWKQSMKPSSTRKPANLMGTRARSAFCRKWQVNSWPDRTPQGLEWNCAHQKCPKSGTPFSRQPLATGYAKRYLTSSAPSSKFSHQGKSKWML